jgi:hypothetical protein
VKGVKIDLKSFLFLNDRINDSIENLCQYNSYVNFAETLLCGMQIEGDIKTVFNCKRFITSLKRFQRIHRNSWEGFFTYKDKKNTFIFKAPNFIKELT